MPKQLTKEERAERDALDIVEKPIGHITRLGNALLRLNPTVAKALRAALTKPRKRKQAEDKPQIQA